jgi:hypothetical protein
MDYCKCETPAIDVFVDAACRRCGCEVDFAGPPRTVSCGCCEAGCVCGNHCDVPRGVRVGRCDYHKRHGHPLLTSAP